MEDERTVMPMDAANCALPEFVGTAVLDTIGLVLPSIDRTLLDHMPLPRQYPAIGSLSSRSGAAGQIVAVDDAVKATNTGTARAGAVTAFTSCSGLTVWPTSATPSRWPWI